MHEQEIDTLVKGYTSQNFTFFGLTSGIAATAFVALLAAFIAPIPFSLISIATITILACSCLLCTILAFDYKSRADKDRQNSARVIDTVRRETVEVEIKKSSRKISS